jgi:MOSC domain-containing protein YiiM
LNGVLESIFMAPRHGLPQHSVDHALLTAGVGLEGDRYAGTGVVSLIQAEEVERFNARTGLGVPPEQTGRNLLTRGVALNALVGQRFRIGDVLVQGVELCDPCATLGARLEGNGVDATTVVRTFANSAGLRVQVLSTGPIAPGSAIRSA